MKNLLNNYIFQSFITSTSFDETDGIKSEELVAECYRLKTKDEGVTKSNVGGWHSKVIHGFDVQERNLQVLVKAALDFGNQVAGCHNLETHFRKIDWWININPEYTYNAIHAHPKADLSLVYYVKVNSESGTFSLIRNDGSMHTDLYNKRPELTRFNLQPVVGRMYAFPSYLLHHTTSNDSKEDRISIAFNLTI